MRYCDAPLSSEVPVRPLDATPSASNKLARCKKSSACRSLPASVRKLLAKAMEIEDQRFGPCDLFGDGTRQDRALTKTAQQDQNDHAQTSVGISFCEAASARPEIDFFDMFRADELAARIPSN